MTFVARLLAEQKAIAEQIARTDALCDRPTPPDAGALAEARWTLVRLLMEHVSFEERAIFAPLDAHADPALRARGRDVRTAQLAFNDGLVAHARKWTAEAVARDWAGYRRAMAAAHRSIMDHAHWEARELFPFEPILTGGEQAAVRHNWVREAWTVREAMTGR